MTRSDAPEAGERPGKAEARDPRWVAGREVDWDGVGPGLSRFNFLDADLMPASGTERRSFLDVVVRALLPPSGRDESRRTAALLLTSLLEAVCALVDAGAYERFGGEWRDMPASLPMVASWYRSEILAAADPAADEVERTAALRRSLCDFAAAFDGPALAEAAGPDALDGLRIVAAGPWILGAVAEAGAALSRFRGRALKRNTMSSDFTHEDFRRADSQGEASVFKVKVVDRGEATRDLTRLMHALIEMRLRQDDEADPYVVTANVKATTSEKLARLKD